MGFAQHMITSIRLNSRRKEHIPFQKSNNLESSSKRKPQFKKATKEELVKIKVRLQKNNSIYRKKLIGYTLLISILIISTITFLIHYYL